MPECNDIHNKVGNLRITVTLVLTALVTVLALTGYNIQQTQETRQDMISSMGNLRTEIREDVAKIGGQLTSCSIRIKNVEDRVIQNRETIVDHERRLRGLEKREGR